MDSSQRQLLMERRSMLPENICPETGIPLKPPELLRTRQIGLSVSSTEEFIEWIQNTIIAYKCHYTAANGSTIMLVCEVDSCSEKLIDTLLARSAHCAYHKVWRITALHEKQRQSDVEAMVGEINLCQRLASLLRCERYNLKVYFIDLVR